MNIQPNFAKRGGLIPVVVQDVHTKEIIMLAYSNEAAYLQTRKTAIATYYSTSRQELWVKGATSGNTQTIKTIFIDCDADALVYQVEQQGTGACHTGNYSCFYRKIV